MISSSHITTGAALGLLVGSAVPDPNIALPLATFVGLVSHHALDMITHTDPGSFRRKGDASPTKPHEILFALPDNIAATALVLYVFSTRNPSLPMLFGALGGNLPDVLHNVSLWSDYTRNRFFPGYFWLHETFHSTARGKQIPLGIVTNLIAIVTSTWILFR